MVTASIIFIVTYILMLSLDKYKYIIALVSGVVFILTGILPLQSVLGAVDFNVLLMMVGTMGLVSLFIESKMPNLIADFIISKTSTTMMTAVCLSLFAGIISAFVDNVATVLMIAPVALEVCKKLKTNPVPFIICISVSSNLQGAATLVGDTTAIMLGSACNLTFMDFFIYKGKPSMFFVVELGALLTACVIAFMFRKEHDKVEKSNEFTKVKDFVPTMLLLLNIILLITFSFIDNKPDITNGVIGCTLFIIGATYDAVRDKQLKSVWEHVVNIDFKTLLFLTGLFLMIGGISEAGVISSIANLLSGVGGNNVFLLYTVIVFASVLVSAFIDNIPYVATMLPIIAGISVNLGIDATPLYFGLLCGATLGGNITPIGAAANITGIGILRNANYQVTTKDFCRISIPFTLFAVVPAYIIIWLLYGVH